MPLVPVVVERSYTQLEAIAASVRTAMAGAAGSGVSIAPQDNAVRVLSPDGTIPGGTPDGVRVTTGSLSATGCNPSSRCTLRPFRGGLQVLNRWNNNTALQQCTSGFMVRRSSGALAAVTAAHCQMDYSNTTVYGAGTTDPIATWGPDTLPARSLFCLSVCDVDTEVQLITSITASLPAAKNLIYYDSATTAKAITALRNYGSSWVGALVCQIGVSSDKVCGTITSIGSGSIGINKEGYTANVNKGAYTSAATAPGDSGGPVVNGGTAYGTNTGTGGGQGFFSSLSPALSALSATLCVTSSC